MVKMFEIIFPLIFGVFAVYYGIISFSVPGRKKPVVVPSRLVLVLLSVDFTPLIIIEIIQYVTNRTQMAETGVVMLIAPVLLVVVLVFYAFILKGISVYGITSDDFSKYFQQALTALNIKFTEKMNKVHLDDLNTDIAVFYLLFTVIMIAAAVGFGIVFAQIAGQ